MRFIRKIIKQVGQFYVTLIRSLNLRKNRMILVVKISRTYVTSTTSTRVFMHTFQFYFERRVRGLWDTLPDLLWAACSIYKRRFLNSFLVLSTRVKRRFFLIGDFDVKKDERRRLLPAQKMKFYELNLAKMTTKKWPKLDLASRTAVTAERPPPKKMAKIDDFRSALREKVDFW